MGITVSTRRKVVIAHVCSRCGQPVVQEYTLYAEGRANAFFHEKDMAEEAREMALAQAYEDIAQCRKIPRQLGSMTQVETNKNRMWAFYQLEHLDTPCNRCGNVEPWQLRKKSLWNPAEGPFKYRERIPNIPEESRPALLDSQEAVDAWFSNPRCADPADPAQANAPLPKAPEEKYWVCFKCKTNNLERVHTCQCCGVTKQWSEAKTAKQK